MSSVFTQMFFRGSLAKKLRESYFEYVVKGEIDRKEYPLTGTATFTVCAAAMLKPQIASLNKKALHVDMREDWNQDDVMRELIGFITPKVDKSLTVNGLRVNGYVHMRILGIVAKMASPGISNLMYKSPIIFHFEFKFMESKPGMPCIGPYMECATCVSDLPDPSEDEEVENVQCSGDIPPDMVTPVLPVVKAPKKRLMLKSMIKCKNCGTENHDKRLTVICTHCKRNARTGHEEFPYKRTLSFSDDDENATETYSPAVENISDDGDDTTDDEAVVKKKKL